jgi:hypothetical protein
MSQKKHVAFAEALNNAMTKTKYYDDLIVGKVANNWWLRLINGFQDYMKSIGKLRTKQNSKISNDRSIAQKIRTKNDKK